MKTLGKFEILHRIGQGAMGVVYKARDPLIGRMVALKTITTGLADPDLLERFYREAQSAGALQHPNVVTIFELGEEDHTPFIAMEFLTGQSLDRLIEGRQKLPLSQRIGYIAYICRALAYAHKQGVVHRDIKPANVMVTSEGAVKVVDFGIARLAESSRSQTGLLIGTLGYMSPQQITGAHADARSDIWAAGVLFYELLAYRRPFEGENYGTLMRSILMQDMPPLSETAPETPPDVVNVVDRMLRKEVDERFQTMDEVLIDLEPVWRRLQRAEVADLLAASRDMLNVGAIGKAYELVRRVLQIDTASVEGKNLLEQINSEMRRQPTVPAPLVEKNPQDDETLVGPAISPIRPPVPVAPPLTPTPSRARKEPAHSAHSGDAANRVRATDAGQPLAVQQEVPSPVTAHAGAPSWKQPVRVALAVLVAMMAVGGAYFFGVRRQGTSISETPVATVAPASSAPSSPNPSSVAPPVSGPSSGNAAPADLERGQKPVNGNSAEANGHDQNSIKKNLDVNTPARVAPAPEPQVTASQGRSGQGIGQGATPPAADRTDVAINNPVVPPAVERPSQPVAISPQPVVPASQPPVAAAPPAAKVAEPAPSSKAVEQPVVSSVPPDNLDRQAIMVSLQQLSAAFSHRSVVELGELWPKLPKDDKNTYKRAFDSAKSISREFHLQSLNISSDGALATTVGTYEGKVQDSRGVETPNSGNFYVRFAKKNGRWYIDEARF